MGFDGSPTEESNQAIEMCAAFQNALGTPGVESYIYNHMIDIGDESLGIWRSNGSPKPAWNVWADANRNDLNPQRLSCGFQNLPFVLLVRSFNSDRGHWASTRRFPPEFHLEASWRLRRDPDPNYPMRLLYECEVGEPGSSHNLLSWDVNCEGLLPLGPVGYIYVNQEGGTEPLHRCRVGQGEDHFVSSSSNCENFTWEQTLGFALPP